MALTIYNTLTRREEPFETLEPGKVQIYCCGVTVYDYSHLGHARCYIVWDTVRRYLMWCGYDVHYVQNFTDIDDKILNRAQQEGSTMQEVSERFIKAYLEDMKRLNVLEADDYPRATHTLDGIKRLIHELEKKSFAYATGGDVYYSVRKFDQYGKLSGRKLEDMQAGASGRVADDPDAPKKQDPFDFALWKGAKPGEPSWESPWGAGRPGWHIECSAMIRDRIGDTVDIHMGGGDLVFPHHENEIAQSEAATGRPLAKYWMHNGMVNVGGEKMSKSLGNFKTIRDLLDSKFGPPPMAVRLFILQSSYRKPIDFTQDAIQSAFSSWLSFKAALLFGHKWKYELTHGWSMTENWREALLVKNFNNKGQLLPVSEKDLSSELVERFKAAMDADFNTAAALAVLFEQVKKVNHVRNILLHQGSSAVRTPPDKIKQKCLTLIYLASVLGLEVNLSEEFNSEQPLSDTDIEALIQQRTEARQAKNFAESDRIRDELQNQGITLIDKPDGVTEWHR